MIERVGMLKRTFTGCVFLLSLFGISFSAFGGEMNWRWNFEAGAANQPPEGFSFARTGSGKQGSWVLRTEDGAPSGKFVLAQTDTDNTNYRFPVAVANEPVLRDLLLSVRCKAVSGKVDQACGLVLRYRDENNYYVARANALEDNVRFYHVTAGKRYQLASWSGPITSNIWHELKVNAKHALFQIYWDGKEVIETQDKTFSEAGKVGLWTKADSVTYFDDLIVEAK